MFSLSSERKKIALNIIFAFSIQHNPQHCAFYIMNLDWNPKFFIFFA